MCIRDSSWYCVMSRTVCICLTNFWDLRNCSYSRIDFFRDDLWVGGSKYVHVSRLSQNPKMIHLRIGHTRITHTHLLLSTCPYCSNDRPLLVEYFFKCLDLTSLRNSLHTNISIPHCHIKILDSNFSSIPNICSFLHQANFLSRINLLFYRA